MHTCYVSYNLSVFLSHCVGRSKCCAMVYLRKTYSGLKYIVVVIAEI